jgi:hypothetical protein
MTNELHIPQTAIFLSRMLLAWLGLLRLDFTTAAAGLCRRAIKTPLFPQIFGKNFCKNFSNSLLILINPDSLIKRLSVCIINNTNHKNFLRINFSGSNPRRTAPDLIKLRSLPGHAWGVHASGVMIQSSVESSGWYMHGNTPSNFLTIITLLRHWNRDII